MNKQQKFQKKKEREREVRKKVLRQREARHRKEQGELKMEAAYEQLQGSKDKSMPIFNDPLVAEAWHKHKEDSVKDQIKRNLQTLKALEEEYVKEQATRVELNERLEAAGAMSFKEKLEMLYKQREQSDIIETSLAK